jgi:hypothetical protein
MEENWQTVPPLHDEKVDPTLIIMNNKNINAIL